MKRSIAIPCLAAALAATGAAHAAPTLRVQVDQRGDFLLVGNTLGYECAAGTPAPVVGTIAANACQQSATNINDTSPDVFWESDDPVDGQALADINIQPAQARSTAMLTIPSGATVTHAFLYWAATNTSGTADTQVLLERPGTSGFSTTVDALQSWTPGANNAYQSVADVTALVQQYGSGAYRVSDIDVAPFANVSKDVLFGGWWLAVFYKLDTDTFRDLALFDGFDVVKSGSNQSATLSGFLVPNTGFTGKLGVVAFEGDATGSGDKLLFNNVALSDAQNPVNNFFNGTRSWLGAPVSVAGDLPQLTGTPQSMAGVDLDVVDVTAHLTQGQSSAPLQATTSGDTYFLGGFITSISTNAPDFSTSTKTATDVNGGLLVPGDVLRYTITAANTGNDASAKTIVTDPLPPQVTFVSGSIQVVSGPNAGAKTDAAGDDQAEYDAANRTVVVRLGTGADATKGGSIDAAASSVLTFDVTVNSGVTGNIENQGTIQAGGVLGAPVTSTVTDGNADAPGSPPTVVFVDQCSSDADCSTAAPICNTSVSPHACVACLQDSDCGATNSGKVCDPTDTCIDGCRGTGGNGCPAGDECTSTDNSIGKCIECHQDSDCGGTTSGKVCDATGLCIDGCRSGGNGCPNDEQCSSTDNSIGVCVQCLNDSNCGGTTSGKVCDPNGICIDGCRGTGGNGCPTGEQCDSSDNTIGICVTDNAGGAGGSAGTGGTAGTGGSAGTGGTNSGTGGGTAGSGTGGVGGGSPAGADGSDASSNQDSGCACSLASHHDDLAWTLGAALAAVLVARRRRRS